jgi:hypothetical protein
MVATKKSQAKRSAAQKTSVKKPFTRNNTPTVPTALQPGTGTPVDSPVFAELRTTPDPTKYTVAHSSDDAAYKEMDKLIKSNQFVPLPFPVAQGVAEPVLTLAAALGPGGTTAVAKIQNA